MTVPLSAPGCAWVLLGSGKRLDLLDPRHWTDQDLAVGLSRTYRWGGHSQWELPLSVVQHSLLVLVLRQQMQHAPLTPREAWRELLHDADEGLLGFDSISPLKPHLDGGFDALTRRLRAAITARYRAILRDSRVETTKGRLNNIQELIQLAGGVHAARDLIDHVALATNGPNEDAGERVRLPTLHKAKRLKFGHVFLPAWEAEIFSPGYGDVAEEHRLAYVANTRGMRRVTISHCEFRHGCAAL